MPVIDISISSTFSSIEEAIFLINENPNIDLKLSSIISENFSPGIVSSLIQLLCTWDRICDGRLTTNIRDLNSLEKLLVEIHKNPQLIVALLFISKPKYYSDGIREIEPINSLVSERYYEISKLFDNRKSEILRSEIVKLKADTISNQSSKKLSIIEREFELERKKIDSLLKSLKSSDQTYFFLIALDHIKRLSYPYYFYDSISLQIKQPANLKYVIKKIFQTSDIKVTAEPYYKSIFEDLSEVLFELIHNTHSWARTDYISQQVFNPNIRGANILINSDIEKYKSTTDDDQLIQYFNKLDQKSLRTKESSQATLDFFDQKVAICEISIIDSGPGLANHIRKMPHDFESSEEEYLAVIDCFKKNMTSDESSIRDLRGLGLPKVLRVIGKKGFLRIRTGKIDAYRNFFDNNLDAAREIEERQFELQYRTRGKVSGTLISIYYPFLY